MAALLLALIFTLILDQGSSSQRIAARLGDESGGSTPMMAVLLLIVAGVAILAAMAGAILSHLLVPQAQLLFLGLTILIAATGPLFAALAPAPEKRNMPAATTRTLTSFALRRAGENGALLLVGIATFTGASALTAMGGIVGGTAALLPPLLLGDDFLKALPMRPLQLGIGAVLLCAGGWCVVAALGLL